MTLATLDNLACEEPTRIALTAVLECTQRVQSLIEAGDWMGAAQADAERLGLLMELCSRIEPRSCPPALIAVLSELVTGNEAMIGAIVKRQEALMADAETVGVGRKAVAAYTAVDGA